MKTDCSAASLFPAFSRQLLTSRGNKASLQEHTGLPKRHPAPRYCSSENEGPGNSTTAIKVAV